MSRASSASGAHAIPGVIGVLALLVAAVLAHGASAAPSGASPGSGTTVSLVPSSTTLPLTGVMGFAGVVHFPANATSVQARIQVKRANGRLVYQRTQYLNSAAEGTRTFSFERPIEGLNLQPGTYPAAFSLRASVDGSDVSTSVATQLWIYDAAVPPVPTVLLVKVHATPMVGPNGSFAIDPASSLASRARDQIDSVASLVLIDPNARITLAIAPMMIEEWRHIASAGYTLASGTVVPPTDPVPAAYGSSLATLQHALGTGHLELVALGYSDPNLADLSVNKLAGDTAAQYDAGFSALFAGLETTPSAGTAPAGGVTPAAAQHLLVARHILYTFAESDHVRIGKRTDVPSGAYPSVASSLSVLVIDSRASRGLESGDTSATVSRSFDRSGTSSAAQPVVARIDLDAAVVDTTKTVGLALATLENTPWVRLALGADTRPPKGSRPVSFRPAATKNPPKGFWSAVRTARAKADGMVWALGSGDADTAKALTNSLIAESSAWAEPAGRWALAPTGMTFASRASSSADSIFSAVKVNAEPITFASSTGNVPVTIQNGTGKTLTVVVLATGSGRVRALGDPHGVTVKLAPRETYVPVAVDMQDALFGKVSVEVLAGSVVVARQTVTVRRSFLDRLALVGGIVLVLGGMLVWIVMRVRRSPDIDLTDGDEDEARRERYTESHSDPLPTLKEGPPRQ